MTFNTLFWPLGTQIHGTHAHEHFGKTGREPVEKDMAMSASGLYTCGTGECAHTVNKTTSGWIVCYKPMAASILALWYIVTVSLSSSEVDFILTVHVQQRAQGLG